MQWCVNIKKNEENNASPNEFELSRGKRHCCYFFVNHSVHINENASLHTIHRYVYIHTYIYIYTYIGTVCIYAVHESVCVCVCAYICAYDMNARAWNRQMRFPGAGATDDWGAVRVLGLGHGSSARAVSMLHLKAVSLASDSTLSPLSIL